MLRRGEVFFASHAELNDDQECRPRFVLRGSLELWTRLAHHVLLEVCVSSNLDNPCASDLLCLHEPLGRVLKKMAGRRDVAIEDLNALFIAALREVFPDTLTSDAERALLISQSQDVINRRIPALLHEPIYIASFTRNPCNPTMWGHYAGAGKGFAVVYESGDGRLGVESPIPVIWGTRPKPDGVNEVGIYKADRLELTSVSYRTQPPKADAFHRLIPKFTYGEMEDHYDVPLLLPADAQEKQERLVGLVKYSDWRYEKEVRALLPAHGQLPSDARVLRVSPEDIAGLIFGPSMSRRDKYRAIACCHLLREATADSHAHCLPPFMFFQAEYSVDHYPLNVRPVGVLDRMPFDRHTPLVKEADLDDSTVEQLHRLHHAIMEDGSQAGKA